MKLSIAGLAAKLPGIVLILFSASILAFSQQTISAKAGNIQFVEGEVFLNGTLFQLKDGRQIQMEKDQVLTTGEGYAELLLAPYAYLRLGENASLRMRQNKLSDIQLELNRGSAIIENLTKLKTDPIRVHISNSVIEMNKDGLYRLDAEPSGLRVYGGDAIARNGKRKVKVKSGRMAYLNGELASVEFDPEDLDALHMWAAQRSFALFSKGLFFTKPGSSPGWGWRQRGKEVYNPYYRVIVAANEDWRRYGRSVMGKRSKEEEERIQEALPRVGRQVPRPGAPLD